MEYSAVTQPRSVPRRNGGTRSSTLTAHKTRVSPIDINADPSAYFCAPISIETGLSPSFARPSTRINWASYLRE